MNPMLAQMRMQPIKQAMQMLRSDPRAMLEQLAQRNPNYQQAMQLIQQNGGDARKAFYDLANQKGVDPNEILNMLR